MSTSHAPDRHRHESSSHYCVRLLGGSLELDFPDRAVETPTAPAQVGPLILLALNPGRPVALETFKAQLYDCDPAEVTMAQIQTPISRLRLAGLPIPPRSYMLDVAPSQVDIVDFDRRAKRFIDAARDPDRVPEADLDGLLTEGAELDLIWQDDPYPAAVSQPRLNALFEPHRRRNRRFGEVYVRLLLRAGEHDRATDVLYEYMERYGTDESFQDLEVKVRTSLRSQMMGTVVVEEIMPSPAPVAEGAALAELRDRLATTVGAAFSELSVSAHNLDRIYSVDRVAVDHEARIGGVPVEAPGGAAANTAFALACLGHRVAVAGMIADDRYGVLLQQSFVPERVDCTNLRVVPRSDTDGTGHTLIFTDPQGRRSAYVQAGVNRHFAQALRDDGSARAHLLATARNARLVNLSSFTSDAERRLQEDVVVELPDEVVVGFEPGNLYAHLGLDRLAPLIRRCDVLYLYERQLRELVTNSSAETSPGSYSFRATVEALFRWRAARVDRPLVVVVRREQQLGDVDGEGYAMITVAVGRRSVEDLMSVHARGSPTPLVSDVTGECDAIAAGVHLGLLSGAPLHECADLAFVLANEANSEIGARRGLPRRSTIRTAWARYFPGVDLPGWVPSIDPG